MSNHFTGLSLGPPLGDQRLDLCDLYAFQSPADNNRTAIILNANPNADALHPDAIYRAQHRYRRRLPDGHRVQLCVLEAAERQADRERIPGEGRGVALGRGGRDEDRRRRARSPSAPRRISSSRAPTLFSPAAAATRSFSTSTESRTCSIPAANGTSPSLISAASLRGPAWIRIPKRMCFRRRSSCRRVNSIPSPRSTSGDDAV